MRGFSKVVSGVLVGAMVLAGVSSASAETRYRHIYPRYARHHGLSGTDALVLGAVGALAVGAIIASQHQSAPAYYDGYDGDLPDYRYNRVDYARPAYIGQPDFYNRQHWHHTREPLWDSERFPNRGR